MRSRRMIGALIALLAVLLGCFYMPDYVSGLIDRRTLGNTVVLDAKSISFESQQGLTMPERLALISSRDHGSITTKNGKLSEDEVRSLAMRELRLFFGTSELVSGIERLYVSQCEPMFVINTDDPSINMIVWDVQLSSGSGQSFRIKVDEDTGAILQIIAYRDWEDSAIEPGGSSYDPLMDDAEDLRELISMYYGVSAEPLKYELIGGLGYYTVELDFDGVYAALYGIARGSRFTVNE